MVLRSGPAPSEVSNLIQMCAGTRLKVIGPGAFAIPRRPKVPVRVGVLKGPSEVPAPPGLFFSLSRSPPPTLPPECRAEYPRAMTPLARTGANKRPRYGDGAGFQRGAYG